MTLNKFDIMCLLIESMERPSKCQKDGCKKKLTLTSIQCKCKKYFCPTHRYEQEHACEFDYKAEQKANLNRYLSTPIIAAKVEII
jgi:predicted nucleic acid binding AN1-type Zn finger protein